MKIHESLNLKAVDIHIQKMAVVNIKRRSLCGAGSRALGRVRGVRYASEPGSKRENGAEVHDGICTV